MNRSDIISVILMGIALPIILVMSAANVFATLRATGEPVFLEGLTVYFIAMLAPASSIALKAAGKCFINSRDKLMFERIIYALTAVSFVIWCMLYAINYAGNMGSENDIGLSLGLDNLQSEDTSHDSMTLLTFFQLFTEILVGTALFIGVENILKKTEADAFKVNSCWVHAEKALKLHTEKLNAARENRNDALKEFTLLDSDRTMEINQVVADYLLLKTRIDNGEEVV